MRLIDSHAHLTGEALFPQVSSLLERAKEAEIEAIVNICTTSEELERGKALRQEHPWIYNVAATTPHDVEKLGEKDFEAIAHAAKKGELVAVGETGLDYYYYVETAPLQQEFLRRYLRLALECDLPVVIHCRDAFADFFRILDEEYVVDGKHAPGVLHCFTGNVEEAKEVLDRGWYLSLSGIVTFKKSIELQEVGRLVPLEQLLIETDSPYLSPDPYRGKQNEPAYLRSTAQFLADLRQIPIEKIAKQTRDNAGTLFRLPKI
ncbi:MAG: putative metal-dependent hydrolase YcfH [Chlamydiae bacterium]|nr:putative metal-dependent hydrolase YcfH [Chlamydiota bacterium]